jgi:hypothetical protein
VFVLVLSQVGDIGEYREGPGYSFRVTIEKVVVSSFSVFST